MARSGHFALRLCLLGTKLPILQTPPTAAVGPSVAVLCETAIYEGQDSLDGYEDV